VSDAAAAGLPPATTMRAAFLLSPGRMELREVPVPRPGPGEVLLRVEAALTCGTDLKTFQRGHARLPVPAPFGHELAGVVAAVGAGVTAFAPGDATANVPTAPCGACARCAAGRENLCADAVGRMVLGAYAEYVLLPAHIVSAHLFHRPEGLAARAAAALEPLACVVHGAARIDWARVRHCVMVGDGAIALLFARVALLRGAGSVLVLGHHDARLAVARAYGATAAAVGADGDSARAFVSAATGGHGADLVVECVGTPRTWRLASELAGAGGVALLFGGCAAGDEACFDAARVHYDEVDLVGAFHYTPRAVREALALLASGAVDAGALVTHTVPLHHLADALELVMSRTAIKVAVVP
jgi:L-iditol 2-dehydrogenase